MDVNDNIGLGLGSDAGKGKGKGKGKGNGNGNGKGKGDRSPLPPGADAGACAGTGGVLKEIPPLAHVPTTAAGPAPDTAAGATTILASSSSPPFPNQTASSNVSPFEQWEIFRVRTYLQLVTDFDLPIMHCACREDIS
jgi:hypothetical protein